MSILLKMGPKTKPVPLLERFYDTSKTKYEICIDEAGRGCLFGHVYIACVVLPKEDESFSGQDIKDSKKFSSKKSYVKLLIILKIMRLTIKSFHLILTASIKLIFYKL